MLSLPLDEARIDTVLASVTTAPRALDHLDCKPAMLARVDQPFRPLVVVVLADMPLIVSADTARRLAVAQELRGREGAAHDLIGAADLAEAMTHRLQGGLH